MPLKIVSHNRNPVRIPRVSYSREHFRPGHEPMGSRVRMALLMIAFVAFVLLGAWLDVPAWVTQ
jgi:hypothetical protein